MIDQSQHNQQEQIEQKMLKTTYSKEELLAKLREIKKNTRKPRSDKGTTRGPNCRTRSDAGLLRPHLSSQSPKDPLTVYFIVKTRSFRSAKNEDYNIYKDQDGYFIPRKAPTRQVYKNYTVTNRGVRIPRTVKNIQGKDIDLEKYRYIGLQEMAFRKPLETPNPSQQDKLKEELMVTRATNWLELFTRWYNLTEEQVAITSYEQWRILHYGAPDAQDKLNEILLSKKYEDMHAHIRDEEYSRVFQAIKIEVMNDPNNWHMTMAQIEKTVRQQIKGSGLDLTIDKRVQERMDKWVEEQKGE